MAFLPFRFVPKCKTHVNRDLLTDSLSPAVSFASQVKEEGILKLVISLNCSIMTVSRIAVSELVIYKINSFLFFPLRKARGTITCLYFSMTEFNTEN